MHAIVRWAIVVAAAALFAVPTARAQEGGGGSYLSPFPTGDVHKVLLIGDDLASGLLWGMIEAFNGDTRLDILKRHRQISGLMRPDFDDRLLGLEEQLASEPVSVAVVMLGSWDRVPVRGSGGKRVEFGTDQWRAEYGSRADRLMKALKRKNVSVYWVGLPNARRPDQDEGFKMINEIIRERVYLNNHKYVDAYSGFVDEQQPGGWSGYGPDQAGKMVLLRENDGVNFTAAGNRKLAFYVERELKRDLTQSKAERNVPLAGSEAEQGKIHPVAAAATAAADAPAASPRNAAPATEPGSAAPRGPESAAPSESAAWSPTTTPAPAPAPAEPPPATDQKADNGKISLKLVSQSGREEQVTLDIVRPAIPATVVALVTRRESPDKPTQMGEQLVDQITGGLTVMSSVTPSSSATAAGGVRRLSPTQSPYYRVLMKGERLAPRKGRADDFAWPRPEGPVTRLQAPASASESTSGSKTGVPARAP